ncbi:hypothetical protein DKM44_08965 [Deinococcus irradiatisoli]|uniref:DUF8082 domain-containing protein n=1 Tax=Deinococcus irradiatisoli TaxID=2202254 RepID=A0A2Z3JIB2_9DEIO|nr:hypothetical protein [Deinococcus irradiatisoli]AWN23341.1 hypothetical protein DKM44_08965 [Deinococcus irradiatisoli]
MTLSWPSGVSDQTPLPFHLWRVLDALAARSAAGIGRALSSGSEAQALLSETKIQEALALAEQYAARVQRQEQLLSDELIAEVVAALTACIGPMGQMLVEDALEELPSPPRLAEFVRWLGGELEDAQRQMFGRQLRARGIL